MRPANSPTAAYLLQNRRWVHVSPPSFSSPNGRASEIDENLREGELQTSKVVEEGRTAVGDRRQKS